MARSKARVAALRTQTTARNRNKVAALVGAACLSACSTVYPAPEYGPAVEAIRSATGAQQVFDPEADAEVTEANLATLLDGGLGLSEAVEFGLLNNPNLQAAFRSVGMAHADRVQAGLFKNPSLSAALRLSTSGGVNVFEAGLFGSLADLWQRPRRERVAESELQRRLLELAYQAANLAGQIRSAYAEATATQRLLEIAGENLASAEKLTGVTQARFEAAADTAIAFNLARLELSDSELALLDANLAASVARGRLLQLLGLEAHGPEIELAEASLDIRPNLLPVADLEQIALDRRLDVRAAEIAVQQARAEVDLQRGLRTRDLEVGLAAEKDGDWSLGPGVQGELPLFDRNQAQIGKALEALAQREATLEAIRLASQHEVNEAVDQMEASWNGLRVLREDILTRSEETLVLARESYRLGKTTIVPALEAQRVLLAARSAYANRLLQAATALSDLERATGTPREGLLIPNEQ